MNKLIKTVATLAFALIGGSLFAYNGGYENSLLTDTTIGGVTYKGYGNNTVTAREESGTTIAANQYAQCKKLKSVDLTGVTSIGDAAFAYSALETLTIPSTVSSMGFIAFGGCTNLTSVTIKGWNWLTDDSGIEAKEPFASATNLTAIFVPGGVPSKNLLTIFPALARVFCPSANMAKWKEIYPLLDVYDSANNYNVCYLGNLGNNLSANQVGTKGESFKLATPSSLSWDRPGYNFLGWAKTSDAETAYYIGAQSAVDLIEPGKSRLLYAVWTESSGAYRVRYWMNSGNTRNSTQSYLAGSTHTVCTPSLLGWSRSGYVFLGWAKSDSDASPYYIGGQSVQNLASAGGLRNLYAVWSKSSETYRICYRKNDGTSRNSTQGYRSGQTHTVCTPSLLGWSRDGYVFLGWAKTASATEAYYLGGQQAKDLESAGKVRTLYAVWAKSTETYRIRYWKNDGTTRNSTQGYGCGVSRPLTLARVLGWSRSGYSFVGWAKSASSTKADYAGGVYVKDLASAGKVCDLYAVWKKTSSAKSSASKSSALGLASANAGSAAARSRYLVGKTLDGLGCYELLVCAGDDGQNLGYVNIVYANGEDVSFACSVEYVTGMVVITGVDDDVIVMLNTPEVESVR